MFVDVVITTNSTSSFISNLLQETHYSCNRVKKKKKGERETSPERDILLGSKMTSQGYEQIANRANITN